MLISAPFDHSIGSVGFVRAIANKPCLYGTQTILMERWNGAEINRISLECFIKIVSSFQGGRADHVR